MATADEEFIKQLREVFDLCDELKCGIISVDQLRDIVRKHFGGSEEVCELYYILYLYTMFTWMFCLRFYLYMQNNQHKFLQIMFRLSENLFILYIYLLHMKSLYLCAALSM